jgi:hypothetical protein
MNALTIIISVIIALLGYPIGLFIASLTEEELKSGRKWFKLMILVCFIAILTSIFLATQETLLLLITSFSFILLLALASLVKSRKKRK